MKPPGAARWIGLRKLGAVAALAAGASLVACSSIEPPAVEASPLPDTADTRGPYPVLARATAKAHRSISSVELIWHNAALGPGQAVRVAMRPDGQGNWQAEIPGLGHGAQVAWHVEALDDAGDRGYDPPESERSARCGPEYCFTVLPAP